MLPTVSSAPAAPPRTTVESPQAAASAGAAVTRPSDSANEGNLPVILHGAMRQDMELSPPEERNAIIAKVAGLKTRGDAAAYLNAVAAKRKAAGS